MRRPCLETGCYALVTKPAVRCEAHTRPQPDRGTTTARGYGSAWQRHSRQARAAWVATNGWTCPGWETPPHESHDLVVDHDVGVLCRKCNSAKAGRHDKQKPRP